MPFIQMVGDSSGPAAWAARLPFPGILKADAGTRTPDPFITSEVLYQLSYVGAGRDASAPLSSETKAASSDSPCLSQNAGPIPRTSIN